MHFQGTFVRFRGSISWLSFWSYDHLLEAKKTPKLRIWKDTSHFTWTCKKIVFLFNHLKIPTDVCQKKSVVQDCFYCIILVRPRKYGILFAFPWKPISQWLKINSPQKLVIVVDVSRRTLRFPGRMGTGVFWSYPRIDFGGEKRSAGENIWSVLFVGYESPAKKRKCPVKRDQFKRKGTCPNL